RLQRQPPHFSHLNGSGALVVDKPARRYDFGELLRGEFRRSTLASSKRPHRWSRNDTLPSVPPQSRPRYVDVEVTLQRLDHVVRRHRAPPPSSSSSASCFSRSTSMS